MSFYLPRIAFAEGAHLKTLIFSLSLKLIIRFIISSQCYIVSTECDSGTSAYKYKKLSVFYFIFFTKIENTITIIKKSRKNNKDQSGISIIIAGRVRVIRLLGMREKGLCVVGRHLEAHACECIIQAHTLCVYLWG